MKMHERRATSTRIPAGDASPGPSTRHRRLSRGLPAAAAILAIAAGASWSSAYAGSNLVSPITSDVIRYHQDGLYLPSQGGTNTTVIAVTLPRGNWVITTKANAVSFGTPPDFVRCAVFDGATQLLTGSTTIVGAGIDSVGDISNIVAVNSAAPVNVTLRCSHDGYDGNPNAIYIENSSLHAVRSYLPVDISAA